MSKTRRPKKPKRGIRLLWPPFRDGVGVFCIRQRNESVYYAFREIRCDIGGRAFALHRLGLGTLYHVRVGKRGECSCECLGFLRHGRCKHIQGLAALIGHDVV